MQEQPGEKARLEIAELERLLAEKKQELAKEGAEKHEREAFNEAFRESFGESLAPKTSIVASPLPIPADEISKHASDVSAKAREEQVEALVAIALMKGVAAAAAVARMATPWLMDELHDRLQDVYFQKLIDLRQLKAL